MANSGFDISQLNHVTGSDLVILVDAAEKIAADRAFECALKQIRAEESATAEDNIPTVRSWAEAKKRSQASDLCLLSIPGA